MPLGDLDGALFQLQPPTSPATALMGPPDSDIFDLKHGRTCGE
jgi:hypothetical protein